MALNRYRIVVELDEDYYDEFGCCHGVEVLYEEDATIPRERSAITYPKEEE